MRRLPIAVTSDQFAITILFVFINKVPCQIFLIGAEQGATSPNIISFHYHLDIDRDREILQTPEIFLTLYREQKICCIFQG